MDRALTIALGGLLFIGSARADLKLTPTVADYDLDGATLHQLVFPDGERRITYTPPKGWDYAGSSNRLLLHPPQALAAEAQISLIKLTKPKTFDEATMQGLSEEALALVPNKATNVSIVSQQKNILMIERKETFSLIIKYDFYGQPYLRSVMFLNRKNEQLRFELKCPSYLFPELQKAFQESQYSWQNL
jgi:hypothetical protein